MKAADIVRWAREAGIGLRAPRPFPMHAVLVAACAVFPCWLVRRLAARLGGHVETSVAGALFTDAVFVGHQRSTPRLRASLVAGIRGGIEVDHRHRRRRLPVLNRPARRARVYRVAHHATDPAAQAAADRHGPRPAGVVALSGTLVMLRNSAPPLADIRLTTLDGTPTTLQAHAGQPIVLNLWAIWCPPCRRAMPVLEDAQTRHPGAAIVLLNQGEDATTITQFLQRQQLDITHGLHDPRSRAMLDTHARAFPPSCSSMPMAGWWISIWANSPAPVWLRPCSCGSRSPQQRASNAINRYINRYTKLG